ncbi:alpha-1-antitrypsin-like [Rhinatrema bivittatum]|uniref:alpha-1-antitrypsin-like n=1 Tax=Rhinatrema bivittatum TaxID=194408 RepID=UPI00112C094B|nr:alpha-1-antitrypsin-like [Rhinatrema bivittatum]XP_029453736.1 alpha-1-antitrypsin-like [Rhinatrema bivittatum]XP_029453737.1 alpha-1-antitrypsin-like [Rhinatrema bivittatum]
MRFVLCLCLCILMLHAVVHGDHHKEHDDDDHHHHHHHNDSEKHDHKNVTCHKIAPSNADFAFDFYHQVTSPGASTNVFFSPVSISTALSMLSLGARTETLNQIIEGLRLNHTDLTKEEIHRAFQYLIHMLNKPDSKLQVNTGNAVFIQKEFKVLDKFSGDMKHYYEATAFTTDFKNTSEAVKQVNDYVEEKTHGKIVDFLTAIDEATVLLLLNYIFFRGEWEKQFSVNDTKIGDFHVDENTVVQVPMMFRSGMYDIAHDEELGCTIVRLPYKGEASAFVILPNEGKLKLVEDALSRSTMKKWMSIVHQRSVNLYLPKFTMSSTLDLKEPLMKLGMPVIFSNAADFSRITGYRDLTVSKATHKAVVSVDERGTEAAAVTAIEMIRMSVPFTIKMNRPFLLLIASDETKSILFMGKVADPTAK